MKPGTEFEDEYDRLIYEEEEEQAVSEDIVKTCSRPEIGLFLAGILRTVVEALNSGVKIIVDIEPTQYESAISLLSLATACFPEWSSSFTLKDSAGNYFNIRFVAFMTVRPQRPNEVVVAINKEKSRGELERDLEVVLAQQRIVYLYVTPRRPDYDITTALWKTNLVLDTVRKVLIALDKKYGSNTNEFREKLKYVGRVPHEVLLLMPLDIVRSVAKSWSPPPPPPSDYLRKKPRRLDELVLPESFKEILRRYIEVIRWKGRGSLMLVGLHGSGRKTIAKAIAVELELPSYVLSVANLLSRYVGESEARLIGFFEALRARGGLAVFDAVDVLFRRSGSENVTANLRNILFQEMAREDNNFVMVFTTVEDAPPQVFDTPILGEVKLVVPLPDAQQRERLVRMFLREIAGDRWGKLLEIAKRIVGSEAGAEQYIYNTLAKPFVSATVGMTPGEIYSVMEYVLVHAINESLSRERIVSISKVVEEATRRDYAARQAKIRQLRNRAISLGLFSVADQLAKIEEELSIAAREAMKEREKV